MAFQQSSPSQGWQGQVILTYEQRAETCVPVTSFSQAPLKVQHPLYPEGPAICHSILVHTAGGMVGGDRLEQQIQLSPQSRALITTAAANKIYGTQAALVPGLARQTIHQTLAPTTCLEWFPQETIVFNGAQYRQDLRVNLAPEAYWCGWEITRFGRSARGERFEQGTWRSHLEVWQGDRPLWIDRQTLTGGSPVLDSLNGLAGQPVIGSFALVGLLPTVEQVEALRALWPDKAGTMGISRLQQGVVCRYRGTSSEAARQWFIALWQYLRPWYLGRPATPSRVWPT